VFIKSHSSNHIHTDHIQSMYWKSIYLKSTYLSNYTQSIYSKSAYSKSMYSSKYTQSIYSKSIYLKSMYLSNHTHQIIFSQCIQPHKGSYFIFFLYIRWKKMVNELFFCIYYNGIAYLLWQCNHGEKPDIPLKNYKSL
jgi:hypothetical protein